MTDEQHLQNAFCMYRKGPRTFYWSARNIPGTSNYELYRLSGTGSDYADSIAAIINSQPWQ